MSLRSKVIKGIAYTSSLKVISVIVSQISGIFIVILVLPSDFGLFSIAAFFIGLFVKVFDFGLGNAVIHDGVGSPKVLNTGTALQLVTGASSAAAILILGPWIGLFYLEPQLAAVLAVLSLSILLPSFGFAAAVQLRARLEFRTLAQVSVLSSIVGSTAGVVLAWIGLGVWALVGGSVAGSISSLVGLLVVAPWAPRLEFDKAAAKKLIQYGKFLFASNIMVFLVFNIDNAIVGKVLGLEQLGYYALAFAWGGLAADTVGKLVNQVMFPAYASIREDRNRLIRVYQETLRYLVFVSVPVYVVLFIIADDFVLVVLGAGSTKWLPAAAALRILCGLGLLRSLTEPISVLLMATGDVKVLSKLAAVQLGVLSLAIYPGVVVGGIVGAAVVVTTTYFGMSVLTILWAAKATGWSPRDLSRALLPGLVPAAPTLGFLVGLDFGLSFVAAWERLAIVGIGGFAAYLLFLVATSGGKILRDLRANFVVWLKPDVGVDPLDR